MFKKILIALLAFVMVFSIAACSKDPVSDEGTPNAGESDTTPEDTTPEAPVITDSLEILNTIWALYDAETEKFPAAGGDSSEENMNMEGPGRYSLTESEGFIATMNFPASEIEKIDDAANLIHMMNLNTFTAAAVRVTNPDDLIPVFSAAKENILGTQWMCGFPEKLVMVSIDDTYLIYAYGNGELIDNFEAKLLEAYPNATPLAEQVIE